MTGGSYQLVRHPAYSGWIIAMFATALEDRTLQAELEGYRAYTTQVPYRLLPGVW